jgi:hypothetical protein
MRHPAALLLGALACVTFFGTRALLARRLPPAGPPVMRASSKVFTNDPLASQLPPGRLTIPARVIAQSSLADLQIEAVGQFVFVRAAARVRETRPGITYRWFFQVEQDDVPVFAQELGPVTSEPLAEVVWVPLPFGSYRARIGLERSDGHPGAFCIGPLTLAP